MTRNEVEDRHPGVVLVDGMDAAIIDVVNGSVRYDFNKCVEQLMADNGWDRGDALEWMEYNVVDCFPYPGIPPTFVYRNELTE